MSPPTVPVFDPLIDQRNSFSIFPGISRRNIEVGPLAADGAYPICSCAIGQCRSILRSTGVSVRSDNIGNCAIGVKPKLFPR